MERATIGEIGLRDLYAQGARTLNVILTGVVLLGATVSRLSRSDRRRNGAVRRGERIGFVYPGHLMSRGDLVLALLATAAGRAYSPAQLQKTAFLVTTNIPGLVTEGIPFEFQPYDYGPFDRNVYVEAERLRNNGEAEITPSPWGRWVTYAASQEGINRGQAILNALPDATRNYIRDVSTWALAQSFNSLVKSIYDAYPQMRENSIFRDPA